MTIGAIMIINRCPIVRYVAVAFSKEKKDLSRTENHYDVKMMIPKNDY